MELVRQKIKSVYEAIHNSKKKYGKLRKCEFHIHTPASYDYKLYSKKNAKYYKDLSDSDLLDICEQEGLLNSHFKKIFMDELENGIDHKKILLDEGKPYNSIKEYFTYMLIAHTLYKKNIEVAVISDHNTIRGYKKLKFALNEYFLDRKTVLKNHIYLFLGVEISCSDQNHVIGIFGREGDMGKVEEYLSEIIKNEEDGTYCTSYDVLKSINELDGIGYIAHIDTSDFIQSSFGTRAYKQALYNLNELKVLGFSDISKKESVIENKIKPFNSQAHYEFCCIKDGDSHAIDEIGIKNIWIKFSKITFSSFRKAFQDFSIGIYNYEPQKSDIYIKGVVIESGKFGFLQPNLSYNQHTEFIKDCMVIDFSEDLNCIIGGRGTGKSTLLNVIEIALSLETTNMKSLEFICKHEYIYIVFHYKSNDYILLFLPQVEPILKAEDEIKFLNSAFPWEEYVYEKVIKLDNHWRELYIIKNDGEIKVEKSDDYFILDKVFRRGYSINKLVASIDNGEVGKFVRDTVMYGVNYQEANKFLEEMKRSKYLSAYLRENLKHMIVAQDKQKEIVNEKICGFNESYKEKLKIIYSPKVKKSEYYLEDILKFIRGNSHIASTFLTWNDIELYIKKICEKLGYLQFLDLLLSKNYELLETEISLASLVDSYSITQADIEKGLEDISNHNIKSVFKEIEKKLINTNTKYIIQDSICKWFDVLDDFEIEFNIYNKESIIPSMPLFKSISELSLGQKVAAILSFVFDFGNYTNDNTPLLIDQPEDNLDSQYIFKNLVSSLRDIKNKRQIILVTHSSTLVINSDAEQVIVMASDNEKGWVEKKEYPSDRAIVNHILNYLEGGEASFKNKMDKYKLFISELN